jgi:hypothetical protein
MPDFLKTVAEDLRFLYKEWDQDVETASLRRSSTLLRRLLVQGELKRAWKLAGFSSEPRIVASTVRSVLDLIPKPRIIFASAGGAHYKGVEVCGMFVVVEMTDDEKANLEARGPGDKELSLKDFIASPCLVVEGETVSRHMLVKYIANTQGGAHFDPRRDDTHEGALFRKLDTAAKLFHVSDKSGVYFELLSVGQALVRADDIRLLCDRIGPA